MDEPAVADICQACASELVPERSVQYADTILTATPN